MLYANTLKLQSSWYLVVSPSQLWPPGYIYTPVGGPLPAAVYLLCSVTVVWPGGSAGREPLRSPSPDCTNQLGSSRIHAYSKLPPAPGRIPNAIPELQLN